jgi:predicted ThiF/HesA family dinucleotide-utilizing enzyme
MAEARVQEYVNTTAQARARLGKPTVQRRVDAARETVEREVWHRLADVLATADSVDWDATENAWGE